MKKTILSIVFIFLMSLTLCFTTGCSKHTDISDDKNEKVSDGETVSPEEKKGEQPVEKNSDLPDEKNNAQQKEKKGNLPEEKDQDQQKEKNQELPVTELNGLALLADHMTQKESERVKKTHFSLLDKPWESNAKTEETIDYSYLNDKILYCEGLGALVHGKPIFNALPPENYTGGAGETMFMHMDYETGEYTMETVSFESLDDAKSKLRVEIDEEIASGLHKIPANEEYEDMIALYEAVAGGKTEELDQEFLDEYLDFYYGRGQEADSQSMYWEMDDGKVKAIEPNISEYHFYDEELDLGFVVHVTTPPSFDKEKAYPALVLTDAVWRFKDVPSIFEAMEKGQAEPLILITIGFEYDIDSWDNEVRANIFCDHKKEFLDFICDNMMPYLDRIYKFDYASSTLFGHSQGGVFAHYAAFNYDRYENKPFASYIIGSPTFWTPYFTEVADYEEYKNEYGYFNRNDSYDRKLFITAGDQEDSDYEEYFEDNDSTTEGVKNLKNRLDEHGVTSYQVKLYPSHHYQYVSEMLLEYVSNGSSLK